MAHLSMSMLTILLLILYSTTALDFDDAQDQSFTFSGELAHYYLPSGIHSESHAHHRMKRQAVPNINLDSYYNDCGKHKGCVPEKCLVERNCKYFVTYRYTTGTSPMLINFEIIGRNISSGSGRSCGSSDNAYIAIGFSIGNNEDELLVVECSKHVAEKTDKISQLSRGSNLNESKINGTSNDKSFTMEKPENSTNENQTKVEKGDFDESVKNEKRVRRRRDDDQDEDDLDETTTDGEGVVESTPSDGMDFDDVQSVKKQKIHAKGKKKQKRRKKKEKKKKKRKHKPDPRGRHLKVPEGKSVVRQGQSIVNVNRFVRLAYSSKDDYYQRFGSAGCGEDTIAGKLSRCKMKIDGKNNVVCQFQIEQRISLKQDTYNLLDSKFYIHLVSGCNSTELNNGFFNASHKHSLNNPIHFHRYQQNFHVGYQTIYAKSHGTLMIIAWCILVPNGMFFSRYFKESFVNCSCCRYRMWFAGHFVVQFFGFILSIAATILILKQRSGTGFSWPTNSSSSTHFKMGAIALMLQAYQVFFGGVRCTGKTVRRGFASVHLYCGVTCYITSLFCIGLSDNLGMPCDVKIYIIGLGAWGFLCNLLMMVHFHKIDHKLGLRYSRALYPFPIAPVTYDEIQGSGTRLNILILNFIGTLIIAGLMIVNYWEDKPCDKDEETHL